MDKRYEELSERELQDILEKVRTFEINHNKHYGKAEFAELYGNNALSGDIPDVSASYERRT